MRLAGRVTKAGVPKYSYRWKGYLIVKVKSDQVKLFLPGSIAQWFRKNEYVEIEVEGEKKVYFSHEFRLWKFYGEKKVLAWPPFNEEITLEKKDPLSGDVLYTYRLRVREAVTKRDFELIAELEQYHYASKKDTVAIWWCGDRYVQANVKPADHCVLVEIKGSLPVSRFIVMELVEKQPFEPDIVGYLRIDPPIPLMHRRVGNTIIKNIREKVFPPEWFHPTYWPEKLMRELARRYPRLNRKELFELVRKRAIAMCNTAVSRISRVVIHPDYRGDGLGMTIVKEALKWVDERDVPEMRKKKVMVETIAQMARYHPFFERVGFVYLWDTASGRPVLYYPLTEEARKYIEEFLRTDPVARQHGGRLYNPKLEFPDPLSENLELQGVTKLYTSVLDVEGLDPKVRDVLLSFGVDRRVVQRYVLRNVNLSIKPGEVVVLAGLSGAGKTTLLRLISGLSEPDEGEVYIPSNARISVLIPGEAEPQFGDESILEHVYRKIGDIVAAIELLNVSGLSDAVFYRARFSELSTGQKERAKIASVLAERPNLLVIDEFAAHLDTLTAMRIARKVVRLAREKNITLVLVTHRPELLKVIKPDRLLYVGYGGVIERSPPP
ncbi:MAG: GNAT family N-acetyltransferase [Candidatus Diapherotrites archaeon]|nr:GNAT family N-acetyltransferase [Candidatus Diapherotrites archaeon]